MNESIRGKSMSVISELSNTGQVKINGFGRVVSSPMKRLFDIVVSGSGLLWRDSGRERQTGIHHLEIPHHG
jgi:hypothetical protein